MSVRRRVPIPRRGRCGPVAERRPVAGATQHYFVACNDWLRRALVHSQIEQPERKAIQITALLQGAMLQAIALGVGFKTRRPCHLS